MNWGRCPRRPVGDSPRIFGERGNMRGDTMGEADV